MTTKTTHARRALLPLALAATLGLSACGGDGDTTTKAATTTAGGAGRPEGYGSDAGGRTAADRAALQACLKKQGVTVPTGMGGRPGATGTGTTGAPPAGAGGAPPAGNGGSAGGGSASGGSANGDPGPGTPPAAGAARDGGPGGGGPGGLPGGGGGAGGGRGPGGAGMTAAQRTKLQAAMKACGASMGDRRGGAASGRRPDVSSAAYRRSIRAYATCVRKHGYDLPSPDFSGSGPIFDPQEVDQTDATFKQASAACQSTLRQQGGGSGGA